MTRDLTRVPRIEQIRHAPDLAILAALEATLKAAINAVIAVHPDLLDHDVDPGDRTLEVAEAEAITRQAKKLLASIENYCSNFDDSDDHLF